MNKNIAKTNTLPPDRQAESQLYRDVCLLIECTRYRLATTANAEACIMRRQIGKRIKEDVLYNKRAEYGKQIVKGMERADYGKRIVASVSRQSQQKYCNSFGDKNLRRMMPFATQFPDFEIMSTLSTKSIDTSISTKNNVDYISLTDMVKGQEGKNHIRNWMCNRYTLEFLGACEILHTPAFKGVESDTFLHEAGANRFNMTPRKWIEATYAFGIISKAGRNKSNNMEKRQINAVKRKTELCTHRVHFFGRPNCIRAAYTIDMDSSTVLGMERAEYGKRIVSTLLTQLLQKHGNEYFVRKLRRIMQFATQFPDSEIVLSTQLSWTNIREPLPLITMEEISKKEPSVVAEPQTTYQTNNK